MQLLYRPGCLFERPLRGLKAKALRPDLPQIAGEKGREEGVVKLFADALDAALGRRGAGGGGTRPPTAHGGADPADGDLEGTALA